MAEKIPINLESVVPPNAKTAILAYTTKGPAKALLHRFDGDQTPVVLNGPSGEIEINIPANRTVFLERLDIADWDVGCTGYGF